MYVYLFWLASNSSFCVIFAGRVEWLRTGSLAVACYHTRCKREDVVVPNAQPYCLWHMLSQVTRCYDLSESLNWLYSTHDCNS